MSNVTATKVIDCVLNSSRFKDGATEEQKNLIRRNASNIISDKKVIEYNCGLAEIAKGVLTATNYGLPIDDTKKLYVIVSRRGEISIKLSPAGMIEVAINRDDEVLGIESNYVLKCELPNLKDSRGSQPLFSFSPDHLARMTASFSDVAVAYCLILLKGGGFEVTTMSKQEIDRAKAEAGKSDTWTKWWGEMSKKSAIKRALKYRIGGEEIWGEQEPRQNSAKALDSFKIEPREEVLDVAKAEAAPEVSEVAKVEPKLED